MAAAVSVRRAGLAARLPLILPSVRVRSSTSRSEARVLQGSLVVLARMGARLGGLTAAVRGALSVAVAVAERRTSALCPWLTAHRWAHGCSLLAGEGALDRLAAAAEMRAARGVVAALEVVVVVRARSVLVARLAARPASRHRPRAVSEPVASATRSSPITGGAEVAAGTGVAAAVAPRVSRLVLAAAAARAM